LHGNKNIVSFLFYIWQTSLVEVSVFCAWPCNFIFGRDAKIFIFPPSSYLQISNFLLSGNQKQPCESANEIFQRALGSSNRKDFKAVYIADN